MPVTADGTMLEDSNGERYLRKYVEGKLGPLTSTSDRRPGAGGAKLSDAQIAQILSKVVARENEVTLDTEGLAESEISRVIAAAKAKGLHAARDRRFVLIRDMR